MTVLEGVYPVVSTPFDESGDIVYEDLRSIIHSQIDRGMGGVVLFGIGAEFYKLTGSEREKVVRVADEVCSGTDTDLVVSVTDHATRNATEFATYAASNGADAMMLLPPHFLGPSESDIITHVEQVGKAVDVPVVVQYAPEQTGVPISPSTFDRLGATIESVQYVKVECQPPGSYITDLLGEASGSLDVLVGYAGLQLIEAMDRGAVGVIPGASISDLYREIVTHLRAGRRDAARDLHADLVSLVSFMLQGIEMFIHYEKRLLEARGTITNTSRRDPSFTPDEIYDRRFEECFARIEDHL